MAGCCWPQPAAGSATCCHLHAAGTAQHSTTAQHISTLLSAVRVPPRASDSDALGAALAAAACCFFIEKNTHILNVQTASAHTNYVSAQRLPSSRLSLRLPPTPEGGGKTGCLRPRHRLACCAALVGQTCGHCHAVGLVLRCSASHAASLSGTPCS